jgi:hypothetical protein
VHGMRGNVPFKIAKSGLLVLDCAVDVEGRNVLCVLALRDTFDFEHVSQAAESGLVKCLVDSFHGVKLFPPFEGLEELLLGLVEVILVGAEELLQDELGEEGTRFRELDAVDFVVLGFLDKLFKKVVEFGEGVLGRGFGPEWASSGRDGFCGGWDGGRRSCWWSCGFRLWLLRASLFVGKR